MTGRADVGASHSTEAVAIFHSVSHRYGGVAALDNIQLQLPARGITGLIGPDGAGKSTLLALTAGVKKLQSGRLEVLGDSIAKPLHRRICHQRIAYMPQGLGRNLYSTLSVWENTEYFARLYGHSRAERNERVAFLLESTGLQEFKDRPAGKLSGGMKQKLSLCCSLVHDPELLVLDEPTTGIDPLSRRQFWSLIDQIQHDRPGMAVLVATSYMEEASRLNWVAALDAGSVIACGTPAEIMERSRANSFEEAYVNLLPPHRKQDYQPMGPIPPRSGDTEIVIEARDLSKTYGSFTAVDRVNFSIAKGEIFGFLGSNGCGKSTTMKMLTGLLPASSGEARVLGRTVTGADMGIRYRIGYMSQSFSLYRELSVLQNLELHARLFKLSPAGAEQRCQELLHQFELLPYAPLYPESLPVGVRQRLQLAVAVMHRPDILILDEPTSGVDPLTRDRFWQYLVKLSREDNVTIFVSTHFVNEAQRCDRVSLMHAGRVLRIGSPAALAAERRTTDLEDAFTGFLADAAMPTASGKTSAAIPQAARPIPRAGQKTSVSARRQLWACAWRETLELARDPVRASFALLGPVILLLAFGFGISFDINKLPFAVRDYDNTPESRNLVWAFEGSETYLRVADDQLALSLDRRLSRGELRFILEVPSGFGKALAQNRPAKAAIWIDGAVPFQAETVKGYVLSTQQHMLSSLAPLAYTHGPLTPSPHLNIRFLYNETLSSPAATVPGIVMLLLMLIPAIMTSLAVVRERESGSIANFWSTPLSRGTFLTGKLLPYYCLSLASFVTLIALSRLAFGVTITGTPAALILGAALYLAATTTFGLFISTLMPTQLAALVATPVLAVVPTVNFSGMLTPVASLDGFTRSFGLMFPGAWFQPISVSEFTKGMTPPDYWLYATTLAFFAAVYFSCACLTLKKQDR